MAGETPLRILQILRAPVGGLFRHVRDLTEELGRRGHHVGVIADSITSDALTAERLDALKPFASLGIHSLPMPRTLGFADFDVALSVLVEAVVLCVAGAAAGVATAFAMSPMLNANLAMVLGRFEMSWIDVAFAGAIAVAIGLLVGLPPALEARRLAIVDALRETT